MGASTCNTSSFGRGGAGGGDAWVRSGSAGIGGVASPVFPRPHAKRAATSAPDAKTERLGAKGKTVHPSGRFGKERGCVFRFTPVGRTSRRNDPFFSAKRGRLQRKTWRR